MNFFGYKIVKQKTLDKEFFNRDNAYKYFFDNNQKVIAFDVGANIGQTTNEFLLKFKNITIYAFEPNSYAFDMLCNSFSNNSNVVLNKLALGKELGSFELNCYSYSAYSSFHKINPDSFIVQKKVYQKTQNCINELIEPKKEKVEVATLDSYCQINSIDEIDILKIDVQGFEEDVLLGASWLLQDNKIKMLVLEITFDDYYTHSTSFYDIESILLKYNYMLWDISHIYKDLKRGRTCWVDAIYVNKNFFKERQLNEQ